MTQAPSATSLREALQRMLDAYEGVYDCVKISGGKYQSQDAVDAERLARAALAATECAPGPFDNSGPPYTLDGMDPTLRDLIVSAVHGSMARRDAPPLGHWLTSSWQLGRAALPQAASEPTDAPSVCQGFLDKPMPNPTAMDLVDPLFDAIWNATKTWDVNVPEYYDGYYCGLNGSHVMLILEAVRAAMAERPAEGGSK